MAFQKYALRDTTVLNPLLNDMHRIVLKVVVECAFADSEVFIRVFNYWFLEVTAELKDLKRRLTIL